MFQKRSEIGKYRLIVIHTAMLPTTVTSVRFSLRSNLTRSANISKIAEMMNTGVAIRGLNRAQMKQLIAVSR